ncbi:Global transcription regulator sge1 [Coemansia sp. BCRC 34962]|nr:Global transcription regulator sge1 [Coemansia sp. BCRC 34962]
MNTISASSPSSEPSSSSSGPPPPPPIIDPCTVLSTLDTSPGEVIVGGSYECFTVTGLKVTSTRDAMMIFEACRRGILPRVIRRLQESEKQKIDAGTIVVFDEREAKMKRWTDGRLWTPSRIVNNFLLYRELDQKIQPGQEGAEEIGRWTRGRHAASIGSRKGVFVLKEHGLIKRTISLSVPDNEAEYLRTEGSWKVPSRTHQQHLVAYSYTEGEALLPAPEDMEELQFLRLPLLLLKIQKFRRPVRIAIGDDGDYDMVETDEDEESDSFRRNNSGRRVYGSVTGGLDPAVPSAHAPLATAPLSLSSPVHYPPPPPPLQPQGALAAGSLGLASPRLPELNGAAADLVGFSSGFYSSGQVSLPGAPGFGYSPDGRMCPTAPFGDFAPTGAYDVMFGAAGEQTLNAGAFSQGMAGPPTEYMDALYGLQQQHYRQEYFPQPPPPQHARVFGEHKEPMELVHPQASHAHLP